MARLPEAHWRLVRDAAPTGRVTAIQVRPARRETPERVHTWRVDGDADHGTSEKRAVTLFQAEHLDTIAAILGRPVPFDVVRRNVLVEGLNLGVLQGRRFAVGEVVLEGTVPCHPCSRMEEALGRGGFAAMMGHGGLCARIVTPGTVRVGDAVTLLDDEA